MMLRNRLRMTFMFVFTLTLANGVILFCLVTLSEQGGKPVADLYTDAKTEISMAEGRSRKVYRLNGILHAGIGHKLTLAEAERLKVGDVVSDEQIDLWFSMDYSRCLHAARKHLPHFEDGYPRIVQLAVINFLYQLGTGAFETFPHATTALQAGDWERAGEEWLYADLRTRRWSRWRMETQHRCEQEAERLFHAADQGLKIKVEERGDER